ncbi:unnamed protein product [Sphagnum jensenii]|uniref:Uncharacterized protein n=1 Tax=Sphagnum jensenii TaxID=128206 RepID=A0ABP0XL79_9BRYO
MQRMRDCRADQGDQGEINAAVAVWEDGESSQVLLQYWRSESKWSGMDHGNSAACNGFCGRVEDSAAAAGIPGPPRICSPAGVASIGSAQLAVA